MPVRLNSSGGGSVTLDVPSTAGTFTATVPANNGTLVTTGSTAAVSQAMLASGVAGNGPAFSAFPNAQQSLGASTVTKLLFQSEEFDTNSNYNAGNSRFTPTVAGYYQINAAFTAAQFFSGGTAYLYKNGFEFKAGNSSGFGGNTSNIWGVSALVYMNGSTDFVEIYGLVTVAQLISFSAALTYFQASLVRAA